MKKSDTSENIKPSESTIRKFPLHWKFYFSRVANSTPRNIFIDENIALIENGLNCLRSQSLGESTILNHKCCWMKILIYLNEGGVDIYDKGVEEQIIKCLLKDKEPSRFSKYDFIILRSINFFSELKLYGKITLKGHTNRKSIKFIGSLGETIESFIKDLEVQERCSPKMIFGYTKGISIFYLFCQRKNIASATSVRLLTLLDFFKDLDLKTVSYRHFIFSSLRKFLKFVYERNILETDLSLKVPRYKIVAQPKLPATYSEAEIEKMISTIDRSSPIGKRNYAIILLAVRFGLRASDIAALKFQHLCWEKNTIELTQVKTQRPLVLPLLADVGNAIIDYLKFGRQKSDQQHLFLVCRYPYGYFESGTVVSTIVQRVMTSSGIDIKGKRHGAHSLRHSAALRMLENRIGLPLIKDTLGHQSCESTKVYLRIDLNSLRECVIDAPSVPEGFYNQKRGFRYA